MRIIRKGRTAARPNSRAPGLSTYPRARVLGYLPRGKRRGPIGLWTTARVNASGQPELALLATPDQAASSPQAGFPIRTMESRMCPFVKLSPRCKGEPRAAHGRSDLVAGATRCAHFRSWAFWSCCVRQLAHKQRSEAERRQSIHTRQQPIVRPDRGPTPSARFSVPGWSDRQTQQWLDNATSCEGCG
jgi:hypothetical protein